MANLEGERCECTSGRNYECCCKRFDDAVVDLDTTEGATYLTWDDLWPCDPVTLDGLGATLRVLSGPNVSQAIARLQWMLREELNEEGAKQELVACDSWLEGVEARKIRRWIESGKRHKAIHRLNCLGLQQANMWTGARNGSTSEDATITQVMRCLIRTSDLLAQADAAESEDELAQMAAVIARSMFYFHRPEFGAAFGRYWAIMSEGLGAVGLRNAKLGFDLPGEYVKAFGLTIEQMLALGLSVITYYHHLTNEKLNANPSKFPIQPSYFEGIENEATRAAVPAFLQYIGRSWGEHAAIVQERAAAAPANLFQHTGFYRWPMVVEPAEGAYPIDLQFVTAQATEGALWGLLEALSACGRRKDGNRLREAVGHAFEWYASKIVKPLHRPDHGTYVWSGWDDEIGEVKGTSKPDFLIQDGTTLYVIEATAATIAPSVMIAGDGPVFRAALQRLWAGDEQGSNKMRQLESAWRAGLGQQLRAEGLVWNSVKQVRPVYLSLGRIAQHSALHAFYREVMSSGGCSAEFIDRVSLLGIEELEAAATIRLEGTLWDDLWREWSNASRPSWGLLDYLRRSRRVASLGQPAKAFLDAAMGKMWQLLFPSASLGHSPQS